MLHRTEIASRWPLDSRWPRHRLIGTGLFSVLALAALLSGCGSFGQVAHDGGAADGAGPPEAGSADGRGSPDAALPPPVIHEAVPYVEPEDDRDFLLDAIAGARLSLRLAVYIFGDEQLIDAMIAAAGRHVEVRVLLDDGSMARQTNQRTAARLRAAGIEVTYGSSRYTYHHEKTLLVDEEELFIMTLNFAASAFSDNRDYAVRIDDPQAVASAVALFDADFAGSAFDGRASPLLIAPDNARPRLEAFLRAATSSLRVEMEYVSDSRIQQALAAAVRAGARVQVVLRDDSGNDAVAGSLGRAGVEVRYLKKPEVHAKLAIVDGQLFVGSVNFTTNSLDNNREVGVIVDDRRALERFGQTFDRDFQAGRIP